MTTCSVEGCPRVHYGKSLCQMHYMRKRRRGVIGEAEALKRVPREGQCREPECEKDVSNAGLCSMHYSRLQRNGSTAIRTLAEYPNRWVGDAIGYQSAHARIKHLRGRATGKTCVDCGCAANEWSYDHDDPNEKLEYGISADPVAYSADPNHYSPRCRSCHRMFDRRYKAHSMYV